MFNLKSILRKITCLITNQRGASLVLVALSLVVLMGFAAFCVDAGMLFKTRREMVTAADAAALAGAKQLMMTNGSDTTGAVISAQTYGANNKAESTDVSIEGAVDSNDQKVVAVTHRNMDFAFAKVLGLSNKNVTARAMADWSYITQAMTLVPFFYDYNKWVIDHSNPQLHLKDTEYKGNWGIFNIPGPTSWTEDALRGEQIIIDPPIKADGTTEYSSQTGAIQDVRNALVKDTGTPTEYGWLYKHYLDPSVSMVGLIPLCKIEIKGGPGGPLTLKVMQFAWFEVQDVVVDNAGNGSIYATNLTNPPIANNYPGSGMGTVIGRFLDDGPGTPPVPNEVPPQQTGVDGAARHIKLRE